MNITDILAIPAGGAALWIPAIDALVKVTLVLGAASLASIALARSSAAVRHLVWTLALTSALVMPVMSIALPRWQLPILTFTAEPAAISTASTPPLTATIAQPESMTSRAVATHTPGVSTPTAPSISTPDATFAPASDVAVDPAPAHTRLSPGIVLASIWLLGVVVVLARLVAGHVGVWWMTRRTEPIADAPWLPLARNLVDSLGITSRPAFRESARATMPMASGIIQPTVLMPEDANQWPLERLRIVLLHELAHVKRRDCLTHLVAQLACALHWFNPLAWLAARHIRTERERACDDLVLATGTDGPDYAEELLEIARDMRGSRYSALVAGATLAMAHRSQLEGRLIAILDPKVPRSGVSRLRGALATLAVACVLPPVAAMQPWTVSAADEATPQSTVIAAPPQASPTPKSEPQPSQVFVESSRVVEVQAKPRLNVEIAQSVADAVERGAEEHVQVAVQAAVNGLVQAGIQAPIQGVVDGAVQGAWAGARWGIQAAGVQPAAGVQTAAPAQTAKRANADPKVVAALTAALKDSDKEVRESAMQALVRLRDPSIFEPLVQALKDPSADVRESAVQGLAQLRDKRAVDPLIGALKDSSPSVREGALHALSQLRDPRSVDAIMVALKDENADVREQAVFALGQLRDKRAAPALAALMKDPDGDVREQAVFALGQLRDPAAVEGLIGALRDAKPDVREQAAFALGQIRDARAVAPLSSSLKDENADVREQAAFALGQIRDRSAVEALVMALKDPVPDVREQVAFALGQLGDSRALDALTEALKDSNAEVRRQAAHALGQLIR